MRERELSLLNSGVLYLSRSCCYFVELSWNPNLSHQPWRIWTLTRAHVSTLYLLSWFSFEFDSNPSIFATLFFIFGLILLFFAPILLNNDAFASVLFNHASISSFFLLWLLFQTPKCDLVFFRFGSILLFLFAIISLNNDAVCFVLFNHASISSFFLLWLLFSNT